MRVLQAKRKRPLDLLAVGAGGRVAAACSVFGAPGDVDVWEVASGKLVASPQDTRPATAVAFDVSGKHLLVSGEGFGVSVFDTDNGQWRPGPELDRGIHNATFAMPSAGDPLVVTDRAGGAPGRVSCWRREVGRRPEFQLLWQEEAPAYVVYATPAVSSDGTRVAVSTRDNSHDHPTNTAQIRDAATGKVLAEIGFAAADPLLQLAFSADGSKLLARSSGRTVKVFDSATGQPAGELVHPGRPYVTGMAVHPNGTVACSRNNGTVCFWNLETRELVRALDWKLGKLVSAGFAFDGSIGAAGTEDGQVVVWDVDA